MNKRRFFGILMLAGLLAMLVCPVFAAEINPRSAVYGAKGDGKTDDTAALQKALDKVNGDTFRLPDAGGGAYRTTRTIFINGDRPGEYIWESGAWIVPDDFAGPVIAISSGKDSLARHRIILRSPAIRGKLATDPAGIGSQHGIASIGGGGTNGIAAHGLAIYDARIERLTGHGIHLSHVYGANIYGAWVQWCGVGVWCDAANGTTFYGLSTKYNFYGYENIQSLIGGVVEGNMSSGGRYTELGVRYSVHDVWFEQNNLSSAESGAADIWAGDPKGAWYPVVVSISGSTTFHNAYSLAGTDDRKVPTHNISLNGYLVTNGAIRFFYPNKHYSIVACPGSYIMDNATGNAIKDMPNGVKGPVNYSRPGMITIGN